MAHLRFAGSHLLFSRPVICWLPRVCQYALHRVELPNGATGALGPDEELARLPPDDDPDTTGHDATGHGWFFTNGDGSTVAFASPTIRSSKLYAWRSDTLRLLDGLCDDPNAPAASGSCVGSYDGPHPSNGGVAVSQAGGRVAWLIVNDNRFQIRLYDLDGSVAVVSVVAAASPLEHAYRTSYCDFLTPWQPGLFGRDVRFAPDDQTLYFIGERDCAQDGMFPRADLFRIASASLAAGGALAEADLHRYTPNPNAISATGLYVASFDLTPDGAALVVVASPADAPGLLPGPGVPLPDTELYLADVAGTLAWRQVTDEPSARVENVIALEP